MIAVSLCLLVTGWLFAMTLLIPGVFYLVIGLRGLGRMRAIDHERRDTTDGASRSHA